MCRTDRFPYPNLTLDLHNELRFPASCGNRGQLASGAR